MTTTIAQSTRAVMIVPAARSASSSGCATSTTPTASNSQLTTRCAYNSAARAKLTIPNCPAPIIWDTHAVAAKAIRRAPTSASPSVANPRPSCVRGVAVGLPSLGVPIRCGKGGGMGAGGCRQAFRTRIGYRCARRQAPTGIQAPWPHPVAARALPEYSWFPRDVRHVPRVTFAGPLDGRLVHWGDTLVCRCCPSRCSSSPKFPSGRVSSSTLTRATGRSHHSPGVRGCPVVAWQHRHAESPVTRPRSVLLLGVPLALGGVLAAWWVRSAGGATLLRGLATARPALVVLALAATAGWLFARFIRWQFLLRRVGVRLPIRTTLGTYIAGLPGSRDPGIRRRGGARPVHQAAVRRPHAPFARSPRARALVRRRGARAGDHRRSADDRIAGARPAGRGGFLRAGRRRAWPSGPLAGVLAFATRPWRACARRARWCPRSSCRSSRGQPPHCSSPSSPAPSVCR